MLKRSDPLSTPPPTDWAATREPVRQHDLTLSRAANAWCACLPAWLRPYQLCRLYPRIANRIALCWAEAPLTELLFCDLLIDKRGNRQGFPSEVAVELVRLRHFNLGRHERPRNETPHDRWARHMQAPVDR